MEGARRERSMRIGDAEREAAVRALDVHRAAGRIDAQEYEDRSVRATAARVRGDLDPLFADLPEPHTVPGAPDEPLFGSPQQAPAPFGSPEPGPPGPPPPTGPIPPVTPVPHRDWSPATGAQASGALGAWSPRVVAMAPILAVILFFTTGSWLWFLAIPLVGILVYGGDKGRRGRHD